MHPHVQSGHSAFSALIVVLAAVLTACGSGTGTTGTAAAAASANSGSATGTISYSGASSTGNSAVSNVPVAGSALLTWRTPSTNSDGSPLTNLAGFYIRYGKQPTSLDQLVNVAGVDATQYVVANLSVGTWYFTISSYTTAGAESPPSAMVSETI